MIAGPQVWSPARPTHRVNRGSDGVPAPFTGVGSPVTSSAASLQYTRSFLIALL